MSKYYRIGSRDDSNTEMSYLSALQSVLDDDCWFTRLVDMVKRAVTHAVLTRPPLDMFRIRKQSVESGYSHRAGTRSVMDVTLWSEDSPGLLIFEPAEPDLLNYNCFL